MEPTQLHDRIAAASDDNLELHAAFRTGSDEGIDYYLVIGRKQHEGKEMLKIRYFALHTSNPENDTWMKNGVTARHGDKLTESFAPTFQAIAKGLTGDDGDFITKDLDQ